MEVYQRPYAPLLPVVCIDETNKQPIKETRIPCVPGHPEKVDSVYERNGVLEEARRLAERFEWHFTPKHGSWLDMAEVTMIIEELRTMNKR